MEKGAGLSKGQVLGLFRKHNRYKVVAYPTNVEDSIGNYEFRLFEKDNGFGPDYNILGSGGPRVIVRDFVLCMGAARIDLRSPFAKHDILQLLTAL